MTNDLRIADAPLLVDVSGEEKLPTGGYGNYSTTINQIADFTQLKWKLATEGYVDNKVSIVNTSLNNHISNKTNPHGVTKEQVGLGEVDNTADLDKPVSAYQRTAIDERIAKTSIVDDLITNETSKVLSAKQGKVLQDTKADKTEVTTSLNLKADKTEVTTSLNLKADKTEVTTSLNLKADKTEVTTSLNLKEDKVNKGVANGYASLDENKKVPIDELPEASVDQKGITQLINNLTTGGTDKAITAQQVKNFYEVFTGGQLYFKIPNPTRPSANWIVQFFITSSVSSGSTPTTSNFPVAFPNTCVLAVCSYTNSLSPNSAIVANITSISKTQIGLTHQQTGASAQFNCIAIGY